MRTKPKLNKSVFVQRIRKARSAKKLTGEQVAELCGVSDGYYRKVESGQRGLSMTLLLDLCSILDVSPDYLLGFSYKEPDPNPHRILAPEHQALVQDVSALLESRLGKLPVDNQEKNEV